jgi:replication factor C large subunit
MVDYSNIKTIIKELELLLMMRKDSFPWIRKHSPSSISEIAGQSSAVRKILNFIQIKPKGKAAFLYGPTGSGKTSAIHAIAKEQDLEILEINASDTRNKASIESLLGAAVNQASLFSKGKIILIDEVDGVSGTKDRGAFSAIKKIVKNSSFPVFFTASDAYSDKLKDLKKISILIEFNPVASDDVVSKLKEICEKEKIIYDETNLKELGVSCNGDLRAAVNDLQTFSSEGKFDPDSSEFFLQREQKETIQKALFKIYKTLKPDISMSSLDNLDINPDEIMSWIEYNTPKEYTKIKDLANALDNISLADVFKGRIRRWQYWRFLVYIFQLLSVGVSLSKEEKYSETPEYSRSKKGLSIWMYNMKTAKKKSVAAKLAEVSHLSKKQAYNYVDTLKFMIQNTELKSSLIEEMELEDSEIEWLEK